MPREFLRVTKEATPGTFDAAASAGNKAIIRLDRSNAFQADEKPLNYTIRDAGGSNRPVQRGTEQMEAMGTFSTPLYYPQAALLIPWATNITGDPYELYTMTFDHCVMMEDTGNTKVYARHLGCKAGSMKLSANNSGDGVVGRLDFGFRYTNRTVITSTDFPTPALTDYPTDLPAVFQDMAGGLILRTSRTSFSSFDLTVANVLAVSYDESQYPQAVSWRGRDLNASVKFRYKSAADRDAMKAADTNTFEVTLSDGGYVIHFDFFDSNQIMTVDEDRPLDNAFYQTVGLTGMIDLGDGSDLAVTITGP